MEQSASLTPRAITLDAMITGVKHYNRRPGQIKETGTLRRALKRTLAARMPIAVLEYALAERHPLPGVAIIPIVASSMRPRST